MKANPFYKKAILTGLAFLLTLSPVSIYAFPRSNNHSGTATTTASAYTATFNPSAWCVSNDSTSVDLFVNFVTTATTANDSSNVTIKANSTKCWRSADVNVLNTLTLSVITASSTAAYRMEFFRGK